jgi:hypothetical protein
VDYTDKIHQEIFGSALPFSPLQSTAESLPLHIARPDSSDVSGPNLERKLAPTPRDRNLPVTDLKSAAIAEEPEDNCTSQRSAQPGGEEKSAWPKKLALPQWRNRIRTNPYVNWNAPESVQRMEKPVEITEL